MKASKLVTARNIYASYEMCLEALALEDEQLRAYVFGHFDVAGGVSPAIMEAAELASPAILVEIRGTLNGLIAEKRLALRRLGVEFPPEGKDE